MAIGADEMSEASEKRLTVCAIAADGTRFPYMTRSDLELHDMAIALYCHGLTTDQPDVFRLGFDTAPPDYEGPVSLPIRVQEPGALRAEWKRQIGELTSELREENDRAAREILGDE